MMRGGFGWLMVVMVGASLAGGCARRARVQEPRGPMTIAALEPRVDVVLGNTAVIPVSVEGAIRAGYPGVLAPESAASTALWTIGPQCERSFQ